VGNIEKIAGFVRIGVQLHRPGDKILLLKEVRATSLQGYLAHKKQRPPKTLQ